MPRLLPLLLVLGLLATACGQTVGNPGVAAAVGDRNIEVSLVQDRFLERADSAAYAEAVAQLGEADAEIQERSRILGQFIVEALLEAALDQRGLDLPTEEDVQAELQGIIDQFPDEATFETELAAAGLTLEGLTEQVRLQTLAQAIEADIAAGVEVTDEEIQDLYEQQVALPEVAHILVETEDEALDVIAELEDGADFEALALERSLDTGSAQQGGVVGQLTPGAFVEPFELAASDLEPGEISEPVETQFGWHVIRTSAPPELDDELRAQIEESLQQQGSQQAMQAFMIGLSNVEEVTVNPRFGRWDGAQQIVVAGDPLGDLQPAGGAAADGLQDQPALPPTEQPG
ncbi:peptidylprolyl isomerase [Euzebya rosea]|uniref:peptidylprolyl isomerase n=1 Tax=Euzebya rosea TaxID=2052804 RepID=UPI000D3E161E|nr:peptidylprolyl isomerase [Euzebya rosea]